jgi:diguanylate cyclase (GGDEF)-like protein
MGFAGILNTISNSSVAGKGKYHLRDRLTDALSRPQFLELLEHEKRIADQTGKPFVLCLVDIDQLRNINDREGQRAGDAVLLGVAERLRNLLDSPPWTESVYLHARFDGDSLMLFVPNCGAKKGVDFAEALRARIAGTTFGARTKATASIAVVACSRTLESVDELVSRAERTMHLAKQFGSDHVELAPPPPAPPCRMAQIISFDTGSTRRRRPAKP